MGKSLGFAVTALATAAMAPLATAQSACGPSASKASMVFVDLYNGASTALQANQHGAALEQATAAMPYARGDMQMHALISIRIAALAALKDTAKLRESLPALSISPCATIDQIADAEETLARLVDAPDQ